MAGAFLEELRALLSTGFTGTLTLHIKRGTVQKCEKVERWRPTPEDGRVELSEVAEGR